MENEIMERELSKVAPLEAVLFDIDGTLGISDPFHHKAWSEVLQKVGFNGGVPITVEFGMKNMAGRTNEQIGQFLFPDWDQDQLNKLVQEKEALFESSARQHLKEINGLHKFCKWIEEKGLNRAAVTNAPRYNAELMISILGLSEFFPFIVTGEECGRAKPFPDPYLEGLRKLNASPDHTLVFEDSLTGVKAGVAAGMQVIGVAAIGQEKSLAEAGATLCIRDYEDENLWSALEKLNAC
ncbi:Haloacid dehalogenase-like hydrolase domain-containing protein Sgpp [Rhynchospora pubera]|uniref:Haloacid dehalogenase-like hydrolase domain-containing protein Sgpp n=1 Tax=Rhynchospora pubera TaxID=906938 RepID=A0AAV8E8G0_9POAL|nr:Haloacid dehalogenase-like hydrolase domain-containing protein Sgpp [Rhynchospora pubera]